jgi:hypothetical protein
MGYKPNQLESEIIVVFCKVNSKHMNTVYGWNVGLCMLTLVVHIETVSC